MVRTVAGVVTFCLLPMAVSDAQLATVGAGVLLSSRPPEPVYELHVASPPIYRIRAYTTLSWSEGSAKPTVITAAERTVLARGSTAVGLGGGALWLEGNDYRPYPILVSSAVVRLPIPRTSAVAIASTQPFQDFESSLVLKVSVAVWFRR